MSGSRPAAVENQTLMPQYGGMEIGDIITLGKDKNKKGDLFNKLVFDVLHALGFENPLENLPKPGRELDLTVQHRTERRKAIVESKAQAEKIGGSDINKFAGAVYAERGKHNSDGYTVTGYYISKAGFTATALEQEQERSAHRRDNEPEIILMGPEQLARELINGNILCPLEKAAGAVRTPDSLDLCRRADLIASEYGWIWSLYYSPCPNQTATHFAFVHADGKRLLNSLADRILETGDPHFANLSYIPADEDAEQAAREKREAKEAYFDYLARELGEIQFEGMPTGRDSGAVKVNLENVFVPLRYITARRRRRGEEFEGYTDETTIKAVLTDSARAAILARPGGGKSTLIRRIALAYAFPERRAKVDDGMPDMELFPIYIRCRDLGSMVTGSITEIIDRIIYRAEKPQYAEAFKSLVEDELQDGRLLLLIDGLDEIANERERICFVDQLRAFVSTYPTARLVVTSRETGFRAVARTINGYCTEYSIADLDDDQIRQLSFNWHNAILNGESRAREDSERVCDIILGDERIKALAINPLLLTTLLFVKRSVGYLPTKRCALYEEMIKLLLVTWNSTAHDRLDLDETEPQLAFVAHYMTSNGRQTITRDELTQCIIRARKELPEILGYTKISPTEFIDKVEERSSLLIQRGLEENDRGILVQSYEFSHLSFQEYLTAKAIVETWLPESAEQDVVSVLENHLEENQWFEVIPLAAVLSGRKARPIIKYLLEKAEECDKTDVPRGLMRKNYAAYYLANCIANEVNFNEDDLEKAVVLCVKNRDFINRASQQGRSAKLNVFDVIMNSKYEPKYRETVEKTLFGGIGSEYFIAFSNAWIDIYINRNGVLHLEQIVKLLKSDITEDRVKGALLGMRFSFQLNNGGSKRQRDIIPNNNDLLVELFSLISSMLESGDELSVFSSAWLIAWAGYNESNIIPNEITSELTGKLIELWIKPCHPYAVKRALSWSLYSIIHDGVVIADTQELREAVSLNLSSHENTDDIFAALHVGLLIGMLSKEDAERIIHDNNYHLLTSSKYFSDRGIKRF